MKKQDTNNLKIEAIYLRNNLVAMVNRGLADALEHGTAECCIRESNITTDPGLIICV